MRFRRSSVRRQRPRFAAVYGVDKGPNFEGQNVLYVPEGAAAERALKEVELAREKLLTARAKREYPLLDTKIIVNWNGLNDRGTCLRLSSAW